jgi:hypothetical protein
MPWPLHGKEYGVEFAFRFALSEAQPSSCCFWAAVRYLVSGSRPFR